jgi:hypothetical protein
MKHAGIFLITVIILVWSSLMLSAPSDLEKFQANSGTLSTLQERTEYFVDFEGDGETKTSYTAGTVSLSGKDWLLDNILIGTHDNDLKFGDRSARFRHQTALAATMTMLEDKVNGLGTLSFYYSRSNFSNDGAPDAPVIVVEYSTNQGDDWVQIGTDINLDGVNDLTLYSNTVNVEGNVRIRFRSISGSDGRRFNIDDILLTDHGDDQAVAMPTFDPPGSSYFGTVMVTISTTTPDATIYYTTDESEPTEDSFLFADPIEVDESMVIKARGYAAGFNPSLVSTANYTIITPVEVTDVAALRSSPQDDTVYHLSNEVILTFQQSFRSQKYIQDNTAGILIDDNSGIITTDYEVYDGITGLMGTLSTYGNMVQFVPVQDPGAASSENNQVLPLTITLADYIDNFMDYQSRLVKINNVSFTTADGTAQFSTGQVYPISDGTLTIDFRTTFYDADYIGEIIPIESISLQGLPNSRSEGDFITARSLADFLPASGDIDLIIQPQMVNFGEIVVNEVSEPVNITLTNNGSINITLVDLLLDGDDTADFILEDINDYPLVLTPQEEIDFNVSYSPTEEGLSSAFVEIEVTDNDNVVFYEVSLSGNGVLLNPPQNVAAEIINWHDVEITWESPQTQGNRQTRELLGYDVYRNDFLISPDTPLPPSVTAYVDLEVPAGLHEYYVRALYSTTCAGSDTVEVSITESVGLVGMNPEPGSYQSEVTVTLSVQSDDWDGVIFYTLDGTEPNDESLVYDNPIYITETLTIKARAYEFGAVTGEVSSGEYLIVVSTDDGSLAPLTTILRQNYPNPFNPETVISFSLKEDDRVRISVYNIRGERIYTLLDSNLEAGEHSLLWEGKDDQGRVMPTGVYFYRMETSKESLSKKMLLIK